MSTKHSSIHLDLKNTRYRKPKAVWLVEANNLNIFIIFNAISRLLLHVRFNDAISSFWTRMLVDEMPCRGTSVSHYLATLLIKQIIYYTQHNESIWYFQHRDYLWHSALRLFDTFSIMLLFETCSTYYLLHSALKDYLIHSAHRYIFWHSAWRDYLKELSTKDYLKEPITKDYLWHPA
jgi:hypothetical protein